MIILALDSAGHGCSACVWHDGKILATQDERMERGQDRRLIPLIESVLHEARVDYAALDRIAVTRGPGSFTGLRIGLAAARGIGFAAQKPVLGIDRFSIVRAQISAPDKNLLAIIDAKRTEFFCRFYPTSGAMHEPTMMTETEIAAFLAAHPATVIGGDPAFAHLSNYIPATESETITLARLAALADTKDASYIPRPLYIRAPDVTYPNPECSFRTVTTSDIATLTDLHRASFSTAAWSAEQIQGSLALPTTLGIAAMRDKAMLGFILCQTTPDESEILTFCVDPTQRAQGIGGALVRYAIATLKQHSKRLFLEVAADNAAARRVYEKHGFAVFGTRPAYYQHGDTKIDAALYQLTFTAA